MSVVSENAPQSQQLDPQQAEQIARDLIRSHPHVLAQVFGHAGQGSAPQGAGAAQTDWLAKLPQIIAFVQAAFSALQQSGLLKSGA